jgi:hypothetical protein
MGPLGHFAVGLAAKPVALKVPLGVLLPATEILDIFAVVLTFAGIEGAAGAGNPWSHGLFMSVVWSVVAAFLAARLYRNYRASVVVGLLVLSHWVLDLGSHPIPFSSFSWLSWQWSFGHPAIRPPASIRWLAESRIRLVQPRWRRSSHCAGVWDVPS